MDLGGRIPNYEANPNQPNHNSLDLRPKNRGQRAQLNHLNEIYHSLFAMTLGNVRVNDPDPISVKKPKGANSIRSIRLNRSTNQWSAAFSQFATTSHDKATVWLNTGGCDHECPSGGRLRKR